MLSLKASVRNGRLVLDEPTELPEGAVVDLVAIDPEALDDLDDVRKAELDRRLDELAADGPVGLTWDEVVAHARARSR